MSSIKNNFINEIIDICISEVSKDETKQKINTYIIEPSFTYIFDRLYPYIMVSSVIFFLILLFLILVFIMLFRSTGLWSNN